MKTRALLDSLGVAEDGVSPLYPDNFSTDIGAAFDEDMGAADAKIQVLTADLVAAQNEVAQLKAHNYDLLMAQSAAVSVDGVDTVDAENTDEENDETSDGETDDDGPTGMDRIFSKKDEDK